MRMHIPVNPVREVTGGCVSVWRTSHAASLRRCDQKRAAVIGVSNPWLRRTVDRVQPPDLVLCDSTTVYRLLAVVNGVAR
jgi:hypothetical protein